MRNGETMPRGRSRDLGWRTVSYLFIEWVVVISVSDAVVLRRGEGTEEKPIRTVPVVRVLSAYYREEYIYHGDYPSGA